MTMFTIDQIKQAHLKVKSGADFPRYVQDLKKLGVAYYDHYLSDGHTRYFGSNGLELLGEPRYPTRVGSSKGNTKALKHSLSIHQQGQTDFLKFCKQAVESGVEKWTVHVINMTCTYYDKSGSAMVVEEIPGVLE